MLALYNSLDATMHGTRLVLLSMLRGNLHKDVIDQQYR